MADQTITRYRMVLGGSDDDGGLHPARKAHAHGEWVRYEDHVSRLEAFAEKVVADLQALADALTAAHAARDAAEQTAREHEIAKYRAEERANEAVDLLKTRTELAEVAKTGENWPCNACGFGHSATIDAHYEARCAIIVQLAEHERDEARAQLTTALRERDEARAALERVLRVFGAEPGEKQ